MGPGAGGFSGECCHSIRFDAVPCFLAGTCRTLASFSPPSPSHRIRSVESVPYDLSAATEESMNEFQGASAGSRQRVASITGPGLAQGQVSQRWAEDTGAPSQRSRRIMRGSEIVFLNVFASNF